jgi:hypothetical protein
MLSHLEFNISGSVLLLSGTTTAGVIVMQSDPIVDRLYRCGWCAVEVDKFIWASLTRDA